MVLDRASLILKLKRFTCTTAIKRYGSCKYSDILINNVDYLVKTTIPAMIFDIKNA